MTFFGLGKRRQTNSTVGDNPARVIFSNTKTGVILGATLNQVETVDSLEIPFFFPHTQDDARKLREQYLRDPGMTPNSLYAVLSGFANGKATGIVVKKDGDPISPYHLNDKLGLPSGSSRDFSTVPHFEKEPHMQIILIELMKRVSPIQDRTSQTRINEEFAAAIKVAYHPWQILFEPMSF